MATRRGGRLARRPFGEKPGDQLERRIDAVESRIARLEATASAEGGIDGWRAPHTSPRDGRTRALVLAILSDGSVQVCIATAPGPDARWYVEGSGWFAEVRGWQPLPEIPEGLRHRKSGVCTTGWRPIGEMPFGTKMARLRRGDQYTYGGYGEHGGLFDGNGRKITWEPTEWQQVMAS